ncbi:MAG: [protein-PII] uridylyltransferase [Acidimicrobiales bacterium]
MTVPPPTAELLAREELVGAALSRAWTDAIDDWLRDLVASVGSPGGFALAAVGGYGRRELSPCSDLDLLLLHDGATDPSGVADLIWYPIWDTGMKVGHAVRRPAEALDLAADDIDTATALLDIRPLGGDENLVHELADKARRQWQDRADRLVPVLFERTRERHEAAGEVVFLLEPDLKMGRGGLRDVHTLRWLDLARPILEPSERGGLVGPHHTLLAVRVELHRRTGRASDQLLLQEQDEVAAALGHADADELMASVAAAARTIGWIGRAVFQRAEAEAPKGRLGRLRRQVRVELDHAMSIENGVVRLGPEAAIDTDALLPLRVARAAADHGAFIDRPVLDRLAESAARLPDPWPAEARELFIDVLFTGRPAIAVFEALDQVDLLTRLLPEWAPNRSRPQRNAYHLFTIDRHLLETVAEATLLVGSVDRPDLLLLGALLHDIGKGYPGDHSEVGMHLVRRIGPRMGLPHADVEVLVDLIRHHLLLPDVASRRDLEDDATIAHVADQVGSVGTLRLLGALTEADGIATGPAAWGPWKADLVKELVERSAHVLGGGSVEEIVAADVPTPEQRALAAAGEEVVRLVGTELTIVTPDRPGVLSRVAGALALHGVEILEANIQPVDGMSLQVLTLGPSIALDERPDGVVTDVERALHRRIALQARLEERARTYRQWRPSTARPSEPHVAIDNRFSRTATVLDVRGPNSIGLLYRVTKAMAELDLDIVSAKVQTLGHDVVDSFYVLDRAGGKVTDPDHLAEIELAVLSAIDAATGAGIAAGPGPPDPPRDYGPGRD